MKSLLAVYRREILAYLTTPLAYVFVAVFLIAVGTFTFQVGGFFDQGRADLSSFFAFHPWLFIVFMPAIAMRLWSDEARSGAIELLLTLPAPTWALALGKFLAAWSVAGIALVLTFPLWVTVNFLGSPDNAAIFVGYLASFLMAGAYIAIGAALSALTSTQVVAFVLAVLVSFVMTAAGLPLVLGFLKGAVGGGLAEGISSLSILHHFDAAQRGVIEMRSLVYFLSLIALALTGSVLAVDARRGG
ncbi:MAG: ABC transporter permease [Hyphomonadaceae bacterium]|nr:MAG: ABC-2 type transport system permease protein [Caulobacteraceae bacterium]MBT9446155.1 ABC transporter permease [Hyphomonadaceae bacterium]TPW04416.1 MAG: ABC-2 type transport system permease protein [Alphaproteobacteria bacterium]